MMACGREMGCLKEALLWVSTFLAGTCSGDYGPYGAFPNDRLSKFGCPNKHTRDIY